MSQSRDEQSNPGLAVNPHGDFNPAQTGADLKQEQQKITDSENENDGDPRDFHGCLFPWS
jgi:hypothetical protein